MKKQVDDTRTLANIIMYKAAADVVLAWLDHRVNEGKSSFGPFAIAYLNMQEHPVYHDKQAQLEVISIAKKLIVYK